MFLYQESFFMCSVKTKMWSQSPFSNENEEFYGKTREKHRPASITKTLSQSMTVGILWAMLIIVQVAKSSRMIFWITASVCESTEAVASSMNKILLRFSITLPKQRSCLCPTLQLSPLSTTMNLKNYGNIQLTRR